MDINHILAKDESTSSGSPPSNIDEAGKVASVYSQSNHRHHPYQQPSSGFYNANGSNNPSGGSSARSSNHSLVSATGQVGHNHHHQVQQQSSLFGSSKSLDSSAASGNPLQFFQSAAAGGNDSTLSLTQSLSDQQEHHQKSIVNHVSRSSFPATSNTNLSAMSGGGNQDGNNYLPNSHFHGASGTSPALQHQFQQSFHLNPTYYQMHQQQQPDMKVPPPSNYGIDSRYGAVSAVRRNSIDNGAAGMTLGVPHFPVSVHGNTMPPYFSNSSNNNSGGVNVSLNNVGGNNGGVSDSTVDGTNRTGFNIKPTPFRCSFQSCTSRVWLPGFQSSEERNLHMQLHRCQWLVWLGHSRYKQCSYIPINEEDMTQHMEEHIAKDRIPALRREGENRVLYFCPYQTCTSMPYAVKGAANKAHIVNHIRKHTA